MAIDLNPIDFICVAFALHREAKPFLKQSHLIEYCADAPCSARWVEWQRYRLLALEFGVGAERVHAAWNWLRPHHPSLLISAGFCGALSPTLRVGDVVVPGIITDEEGNEWTTRHGDPDQRLLTATNLIATSEAKSDYHQRFNADVVDMESAVWADLCAQAGIPFAGMRSVSDKATTTLSPQILDILGGERVRIRSLATALWRSPGMISELIRLARATTQAAKSLRDALGALISSYPEYRQLR